MRCCHDYRTRRVAARCVFGPGDYAVFWPQDVHRPFCTRPQNGGAPEAIKKIVIKFPAE